MFKLSIFLFFALLLNSCDNSNSENNAPFIIKDSFIVNNIDILEDSSAIEAENIIDDESELAYDSIFVDMSTIVDGGQPVTWIKGILVIQMFDIDHELISEWNAWDHLDISQYTNLNLESNAIAWMHGNSIEWEGNNQILVSNRASNEILKVDLQSGEVLWHIGGPLNQFTFINPINSLDPSWFGCLYF